MCASGWSWGLTCQLEEDAFAICYNHPALRARFKLAHAVFAIQVPAIQRRVSAALEAYAADYGICGGGTDQRVSQSGCSGAS